MSHDNRIGTYCCVGVIAVMTILFSNVLLLLHRCLGPRPCFAGPNALVPRVLKFCVDSSAAVSEPRTAATATTHFAGFLDGAASGAYRNGGRRRRVCQCCLLRY